MFFSHRGYPELEEKKLYVIESLLASDSSACFSERVVRVEIPEGESTVVARRHGAHWPARFRETAGRSVRLKLCTDYLSTSRDLFNVAKTLGSDSD